MSIGCKPRLDRDLLESHGITYSEAVCTVRQNGDSQETSNLPEHVESIRQALLYLDIVIPEDRKALFVREAENQLAAWDSPEIEDYDLRPPESVYLVKEELHDAESSAARKGQHPALASAEVEIKHSREVAEHARFHEKNNASEKTWARFMNTYIFRTFRESNVSATGYDYLFETWALEEDVHWNESHKSASYDENLVKPTGPKPDFTYAFPINNFEDELLPGFRNLDSVKNFSKKTLGDLRRLDGLISSPLTGLHRWAVDSKFVLSQRHLFCFPWAVVELKPDQVPQNKVEFCYCQAANATSRALRLYEKLCKDAGRYDSRVPPVVAFTCIGAKVRVWLAYSCTEQQGSRCHKMICIWAGALTTTWGVMVTCQIVKNMIFWASRILRPQVSGYITQLRLARSRKRDLPERHPPQTQAHDPSSEQSASAQDQNLPPDEQARVSTGSIFHVPENVQHPCGTSTENDVPAADKPHRTENGDNDRGPHRNVASTGKSELVRTNKPDRESHAARESPSYIWLGSWSLGSDKSQAPKSDSEAPLPLEHSEFQTYASNAARALFTFSPPNSEVGSQAFKAANTSNRRILIPKSRRRLSRQNSGVSRFQAATSRHESAAANTNSLQAIAKPPLRRRIRVNLPKVTPQNFQDNTQETGLQLEAETPGIATVGEANSWVQNEKIVVNHMQSSDDAGDKTKRTDSTSEDKPILPKLIEEGHPSEIGNYKSGGTTNPLRINESASTANRKEDSGGESNVAEYESTDETSTHPPDTTHIPEHFRYHIYQVDERAFDESLDALTSSEQSDGISGDTSSASQNNESGDWETTSSEYDSIEAPSKEHSEYVPSEYVPSEGIASEHAFEDDSLEDSDDPTDEEEDLLNNSPSDEDHQTSTSNAENSEDYDSEQDDSELRADAGHVLKESDLAEIRSQALQSLWGPEFLKLDAVSAIVERLSISQLCGAMCDALLAWSTDTRKVYYIESQYELVAEILQSLSDVPGLDGTYRIKNVKSLFRKNSSRIVIAIHRLGEKDADQLRCVLRKALELLDFKDNSKILKAELDEMSNEERSQMERQALALILDYRFKEKDLSRIK